MKSHTAVLAYSIRGVVNPLVCLLRHNRRRFELLGSRSSRTDGPATTRDIVDVYAGGASAGGRDDGRRSDGGLCDRRPAAVRKVATADGGSPPSIDVAVRNTGLARGTAQGGVRDDSAAVMVTAGRDRRARARGCDAPLAASSRMMTRTRACLAPVLLF